MDSITSAYIRKVCVVLCCCRTLWKIHTSVAECILMTKGKESRQSTQTIHATQVVRAIKILYAEFLCATAFSKHYGSTLP